MGVYPGLAVSIQVEGIGWPALPEEVMLPFFSVTGWSHSWGSRAARQTDQSPADWPQSEPIHVCLYID
jgi:hypothetical protein